MKDLAGVVSALTAVAFVALGFAAGVDWLRHPDRRRGLLALSLLSLGVVAGVSIVLPLLKPTGFEATAITAVVLVSFMGSAYFVLLFRDSFIPVSRPALLAASIASVAVVVGELSLQAVPFGGSPLVQSLAGIALVLVWAVLVGEPIVRFWLASRSLPRVQRQRMRALSVAFTVLILILVVSVVAGSAERTPAVQVVTQVIALAMVPVLWVSLAPPTWLRRQWRAPEESELRHAVTDLLIFSPGRVALAEKAVGWAIRLVGGNGGFIVDDNGTVLASSGLEDASVGMIRAEHDEDPDATTLPIGPDRTAIAIKLPLESGSGLMSVLSGPFTPVFGSDEVVYLAAYGSSVTAGLERARVTERLAAMERTKTQFLNLASHELRGPLTLIRGYVSMLENGSLGQLSAEASRALQVMGSKATEMNSLVEQMLEAARLEEGRLELHVEPHDLRDVVHASIELVRPLVDERHPLTVNVPEKPVPVAVDAERIQTIVTNLVDNAVKYSPQGGDVRVEVVNTRGQAAVRVRDHGVGIDAGDLPRLFTRFGRIATAATSHLPGTGLGLYLSRELARLHGGDITVESEPGLGSTFTLQLPPGDG